METTIEGIGFGDHRERCKIYGFGLGVQGVIACNFREAKILRAEVSVVECKRPLNAGVSNTKYSGSAKILTFKTFNLMF